jgi:hypothetical protein
VITVASAGSVFGGLLFIVIALALYFTPTIIAIIRKHQIASVAIVNTVFGWTLIGWIVALVMAVPDKPAPAVQTAIVRLGRGQIEGMGSSTRRPRGRGSVGGSGLLRPVDAHVPLPTLDPNAGIRLRCAAADTSAPRLGSRTWAPQLRALDRNGGHLDAVEGVDLVEAAQAARAPGCTDKARALTLSRVADDDRQGTGRAYTRCPAPVSRATAASRQGRSVLAGWRPRSG